VLKELNDSNSNIPVYVNPDHIDYARPNRDDPKLTELFFENGKEICVKGGHKEVVQKLNS
jgi:hypothetical protein